MTLTVTTTSGRMVTSRALERAGGVIMMRCCSFVGDLLMQTHKEAVRRR